MPLLLDESLVRHVAHLARLKITDSEVCKYTEQLSRILDYMGQLGELDLSKVPPMAHAETICNVFREDLVREPWSQEQAMANAPQRQGAFFKLPKVLDQDTA